MPKLPKPLCLADFRPISVTPILSRLAEKLVVKTWLFPAVDHQTINDQFAFRPTGSTTCTLVFFMHHVTRLSKAFDVVDHCILAAKLARLNMPPVILSWSFSFLTGRTQQVKHRFQLSSPKPVNRGIVQGSGVGPMLYIVMKGDPKALSSNNLLFKYADTNLLVPEITDVDIKDEFNNVDY